MKSKITINNNSSIIAVIALIIILIIMAAMKISVDSSTGNSSTANLSTKERIVTNKEYLYEIGANYIKDKYHDLNSRKESEDYQVFVSYHKFNITQDKDYDYAYMWVLSESYYVKNEHLYSGRTNSSLYKIAFKDDKVINYEMPDDGKDYEKAESYVMDKEYTFLDSLKDMCPNEEVYNSIMNYNTDLSNDELARNHYSYLDDLTIYYQNLNNNSDNDNNNTVPYPNDKANGGSGYVPRH